MRARFLVILLLAATCTSGGTAADLVPTGADPRSPSEAPSPVASPTTFVRMCEMSVFGQLGHGWRAYSILAGPLAFVAAKGYADEPARFFLEPHGRWSSEKLLVRVTGDAPVTVAILPEARVFAGMVYDPSGFNTRRPEETQDAVTFEPCPEQRATLFNGAFLIDGVRCVPLIVTVEGKEPQTLMLAFGPCAA